MSSHRFKFRFKDEQNNMLMFSAQQQSDVVVIRPRIEV